MDIKDHELFLYSESVLFHKNDQLLELEILHRFKIPVVSFLLELQGTTEFLIYL